MWSLALIYASKITFVSCPDKNSLSVTFCSATGCILICTKTFLLQSHFSILPLNVKDIWRPTSVCRYLWLIPRLPSDKSHFSISTFSLFFFILAYASSQQDKYQAAPSLKLSFLNSQPVFRAGSESPV